MRAAKILGGLGLVSGLLVSVGCKNGDTDEPIGGSDQVQSTLEDLEKWEECEVFVDSEGYVCEDFEGGTRYLMADIEFKDDGSLGGAFYWVLVANTPMTEHENWASSGDPARTYCTVGFGLSGSWEEGGGAECPNCTHALTYNTTYSASLSDCPTDVNNDIRESADGVEGAGWFIKVNSDGTAQGFDTTREWAPFGLGDDGGAIVYSDKRCEWLYDGECTKP